MTFLVLANISSFEAIYICKCINMYYMHYFIPFLLLLDSPPCRAMPQLCKIKYPLHTEKMGLMNHKTPHNLVYHLSIQLFSLIECIIEDNAFIKTAASKLFIWIVSWKH